MRSRKRLESGASGITMLLMLSGLTLLAWAVLTFRSTKVVTYGEPAMIGCTLTKYERWREGRRDAWSWDCPWWR